MDGARIDRGTNPRAYTIEHMRPRCHGGRSTADNLRLSHSFCNARRGARGINWYPLPCFRPSHLPALHLTLSTRMHSRFQHWAEIHRA
jgi:hypothetical protein